MIDAQQPGLKVQPRMMLIDDADRQARWYFELKEALLASRRTGQPMVHPHAGSGDAALAQLGSSVVILSGAKNLSAGFTENEGFFVASLLRMTPEDS